MKIDKKKLMFYICLILYWAVLIFSVVLYGFGAGALCFIMSAVVSVAVSIASIDGEE